MPSELKFRTMGNATIQCIADGSPVLTTDPWLTGRAYFDSWGLHHPLSDADIRSCIESDCIWISHGHPDHMHIESLRLMPKGKRVLIPDHYSPDIYTALRSMEFRVEILKYRQWVQLTDDLHVSCLDNINQDAILVIRFGDALLLNLNDSPFCGEFNFLRRLVQKHPHHKTFAFRLCAISADMLNIVDAQGERIIAAAEDYRSGAVRACAELMADLGVRHFCFSSSQHIFVRPDSKWANDYEITIADMHRYWNRSSVKLIDPFITFDLHNMTFIRDWPQERPDYTSLLDTTGADDWNDRLTTSEWDQVTRFFGQFSTLATVVDFVDVQVGGKRRRVFRARPRFGWRKIRGVCFTVPRYSLLETVKSGYFDDLLLGNFMKTHLINIRLYPDFTPRIAKFGGSAKVFTNRGLLQMIWHYVRRNPAGVIGYLITVRWYRKWLPTLVEISERWGVRTAAKWIYHKGISQASRIIFRE